MVGGGAVSVSFACLWSPLIPIVLLHPGLIRGVVLNSHDCLIALGVLPYPFLKWRRSESGGEGS